MAKFEIGDRVRIRKAVPAEELFGWPAPKGSAGVVTIAYRTLYTVLLDDHPDQITALFGKDEIEAES